MVNDGRFHPSSRPRSSLTYLPAPPIRRSSARKHNLKPQLIASWKATVLERLPMLFQEDGHSSQDQLRIAELEQLVGRQAYDLEILKKASRMLPGLPSSNGRLS